MAMNVAATRQGGSGANPGVQFKGRSLKIDPAANGWEQPIGKHVLLTVPAGYKPGEDLYFDSPCGGCSVVLPHGIKEGDSLQVALPIEAQKIEVLNAYFGRDQCEDSRDCHVIDPLLEHAASELGIKRQINDIEENSKKLDKCLKTLLDQQSEREVDFVDTHDVKLGLCRDRSVATGAAYPMQPRRRPTSRNMQLPLKDRPTSNMASDVFGTYLSCFIFGPSLISMTAVDDRTLETNEWWCLPFIIIPTPCPCAAYYSTLDGITYKTNDDICSTEHEYVVENNRFVDKEGDSSFCMCKISD